MKKATAIAACLPLFVGSFAAPAHAVWTWNIGYHNPAVSTLGLNFLYLGTDWGFETGIGWIDVRSNAEDAKETETTADDNKESTSLTVAGDVDVKYFLTSGKFRPYLQGGVGVGLGAKTGSGGGVGAGTGEGFGGLGVLFGSQALYAYASYNLNGSKSAFVQAGVGADL